jgi:hypothetical protein
MCFFDGGQDDAGTSTEPARRAHRNPPKFSHAGPRMVKQSGHSEAHRVKGQVNKRFDREEDTTVSKNGNRRYKSESPQ